MKRVNMEPKPFWELSDYMQAIQNATHDNEVSPLDKETYERSVRERLELIKQAVANAEKFLDNSGK